MNSQPINIDLGLFLSVCVCVCVFVFLGNFIFLHKLNQLLVVLGNTPI